tara:strand:- start:158 stop:562 length:405 start_codon:yes stop_codon:yes gene_type:complete
MGDVVDMEAFKRANAGAESILDYFGQIPRPRITGDKPLIKTVKRCCITPGMQELGMKHFENEYQFLSAINEKFMLFNDGDWGEVGEDDKEYNDRNVRDGNQVMGVYSFKPEGKRFYLILDAGHETLTALLPSEY